MINFSLYGTDAAGTQLADYTHKISGLRVTTNEHGFADCSGDVPLSMAEAFGLYDHAGMLRVGMRDNGFLVWDGRVEDPGISDDGLHVAALGYQRALSDVPYTAFWSSTTYKEWRTLTPSDRSSSRAEKYEFDTNNRIGIFLKKNETYSTATLARIGFRLPSQSTTVFTGIAFDYQTLLPAWATAKCVSTTGGYAGSGSTEASITGTASLISGTICINLATANADRVWFEVTPGSTNTYLGETGDNYFTITNLRLVGNSDNVITTTLTNNETAGSNVAIEVGSTARMYVGQRIYTNSGSTTQSESVLVKAVNSSTQFTADLALNHTAGETVRAHVVYANQVVSALITAANSVNSTHLSSSTALVQSPSVDLMDEVYEDDDMTDILDYLAELGDTSYQRWEWAVWEGQRLVFQPRNSGRTWYVDITGLEVVRSLEDMYNSIYAIYKDANGDRLRTSASNDIFSQTSYGVVRRKAVRLDTTLAVQAQLHRDVALVDQRDPLPQARIVCDAVYDEAGGRYLLHEVRAGDTMVIRNLPPTLSTSIDRVRSFRITRTELDLETGKLTVEPEKPLPTLESQLARK